MSETAPAGAGSTEAVTAASAVPTPATETTQTAATPASPALGESVLTSDAPPAGETPAEGGEQPAGEQAALDYSTLKLPAGVTTEDPVFADFAAAAAEHKIAPEAAQALIDKVLPGITKQIADLQAEPVRLATERLAGWTNEVMADPEIGGAKLAAVKTNIARTMGQFGNPDEIKQALNETGAGSNPVLICWLNKMSAALGEGTPVTSGNPAGTHKSVADKLYGSPS